MMSLSEAAYGKILSIRGDYARKFPADPPEMLGFGMGRLTLKTGETAPPNLAVGFFRKSEVTPAIRAAQRSARDFKYVILGSLETKQKIGKGIVDYSETRGFFLRDR